MSRIVIPQAVRYVIPTMTSEFVMLYKDTSPLSSIGVIELMLFSKKTSRQPRETSRPTFAPRSTIWL